MKDAALDGAEIEAWLRAGGGADRAMLDDITAVWEKDDAPGPGAASHTEVMEQRRTYADNRPYTVPETLEELTGPTGGIVRLPIHLDWSGSPAYDLDRASERELFYVTVINEATSAQDLRRYLNSTVLKALWSELYLPARVRNLWQGRFPELENLREVV